jgi:hypothetical protein
MIDAYPGYLCHGGGSQFEGHVIINNNYIHNNNGHNASI